MYITNLLSFRNGSIVKTLSVEPTVKGIILRYDVNFTMTPGE